MKEGDDKAYDAEAIRSLEGIELIRARPTLFIDGMDSDGLHRLVFEAIDNSVDEFRSGFGTEIAVRLDREGIIEVEDFGRGIPVEKHPETGIPIPVFLMTKAFAGAKFDDSVYNFSGGLHGVGLKCINAFSEWVELVCKSGGGGRSYRFEDGVFAGEGEVEASGSGTIIRFLPRYEIFGGGSVDHDRISNRLADTSYLNPGLKCTFASPHENSEFFSENGVEGILELKGCTDIFSVKGSEDEIRIDCSIGVQPHGDTTVLSYANGIPTPEGGSHVAGVKSGMARAVSSYAARKNLCKDSDPSIGAGDVGEGCFLVISLRMDTPPFSSQKKTRVVSQDVEVAAARIVLQAFSAWLEESPARAKTVALRMLTAARNREKLKALKSRLRLASQTKKLRKPSGVVSTAGGTSELTVSVKDPMWRSLCGGAADILPMRLAQNPPTGRTSLERLLKNPDYFALAAVVGGGVGSTDDDPDGGFDLSKCRYQKVVIRPGKGAGAKLSGAFVLIFVEKHLPGLIESERVFWEDPDSGEVGRVTSSQSLKSEVSEGLEGESAASGGGTDDGTDGGESGESGDGASK